MALGWKWAPTIAAWLSYSAIVLVWVAWEFEIPVVPPHVRSPPSDDELRHHFDNLRNSTWYNSSTVCKYLLEGAASAEDLANVDTTLDMFEWRGGEWFYPLESSNPNWSKQHKFLKVDAGDHEATFSVYQARDVGDGVEWGNMTHPIQTIGGRLILQDFWDMEMYMDYNSPLEAEPAIDHTRIRNLKILLLGAFVNTGVYRRVCMTGCAYRSDHSNQRDCKFVLKMNYPNRRTLTTRRIEAELSSARRGDDPFHFPAFRITGPSTVTESEYDYRSDEFLQSALNMSSTHNGSAGNSDGPSTADPKDLVTYLEGSGEMYKVVIAPTLIERTLFKQQGKVVVGPFSNPYYPSPEVAFPADLAEVELTLKFKNIVTRASNFSGRVLASGSMKMGIACNPYIPRVEQRPFNVEGIWDTMSEELCMIGCRVDSLNPNQRQNDIIQGTGCDWKICIQSVLRKYVSIDSPLEGVLLSSLYADAQHAGHFPPLGFLRGATDDYFLERPDMVEVARLAGLTTYRYTIAAKAEELAKLRSLDEIHDKRWFHPRYPTPYDVGDFCKATDNMRATMVGVGMSLLFDKEGRQLNVYMQGYQIMYLESCPERFSFDYLPYDTALKTPTPGSYLKVAVQLSITDARKSYQSFSSYYSTPWQCGAEGVYEPFTGKMHLVVHLRHRYFDGIRKDQLVAPSWPLQRIGGAYAEVVDHEIYMKVQIPSIDSTMTTAEEEALDPNPQYSHQDEYGHRYKVDIRFESLRSKSDPLYFAPFLAKNYPLYKPS